MAPKAKAKRVNPCLVAGGVGFASPPLPGTERGLDGGREHTLEEISAIFGITRERVRQLRDRALKRLREGEAGRALASYAA